MVDPVYAYSPAEETLFMALNAVTIDGTYLEFGVGSGRTLGMIASRVSDKIVYGFDSFAGLPEDWRPGLRRGHFGLEYPAWLPPNAQLVVGLFEDTLSGFIAEHLDPVAFLHVDCDLYSSTVTVLHHLEGLIVPGTVIQFDEYHNYPGWEGHESKAFGEFLSHADLGCENVFIDDVHQQVSVRIADP